MFDFYYSLGGARRKSFKVKGEVCSIGSARSNDLVLDTKAMAKRHVELRLQPSGVHITDLGSLSGTWVNRERVTEYGPLSDLDEIIVGDVSLVLDGMPVISDHIINNGMVSGGERKPQDAAAAYEARFENEPESKAKPKRGLFSLFSSNDSQRSANEERMHESPVAEPEARPAEVVEPVQEMGQAVAAPVSANESVPLTEPTPTTRPAPRASAATTTSEPEPVSAFTEEDAEQAYWARVVHDQLLNQMDLRRKDVNRMSDEQLRDESEALIGKIVESIEDQLPAHVDRDALRVNVLNEAVGLGPLERFLEDDDVTEIMVNNHAEIFLEKNGKIIRSKNQFSSDATVYSVIERIITPLGRRIDESSPIVDARLKDGSRVNAIIPPLALKGPSLTIRKFPKHRLCFDDLIAFGSTNKQMVDFFKICVESHKNIIVAGGTGSGKTTLLNVLSNFIPDADRIVTIEDAAELSLAQPNLVSLESRPPNLEGKGDVPIRDLVKNSLRMRPDRIVIGECRGGEAIDMLQAMNTGHDGSLTTIHANTPRDVISRLEVLVLMAGMDLPVSAIREQVASAVHLIVQQTRYPCGSRKISKVTEVVGVESGTVQLQDIFEYKQQGFGEDGKVRGVFQPTGFIPTFYDELRQMGIEVDMSCFNNSRAGEL
jgi:pilus assembly protein CpaF